MPGADRPNLDGPDRLPPEAVRYWRQHCRSFTRLTLLDNTVVHRQGERCAHIYYLASGYIKRAAADRHGRGLIRAILHDGDMFGAVSGAGQYTQDAAVSKGPARVYRCRADEFRGLLDARPDIVRYALANLSGQLRFAQRHSEALLYSRVTVRIALMLRDLIGNYGGRCRHGHELDIRLTQQELAELVGASRPVVSTILNELRERGILSYTRTFMSRGLFGTRFERRAKTHGVETLMNYCRHAGVGGRWLRSPRAEHG